MIVFHFGFPEESRQSRVARYVFERETVSVRDVARKAEGNSEK